MSVTINPAMAQTILTALKGVDQTAYKYNSLEHTACVFANCYGELILITSQINHKTIGKVLNEKRFQLGRLQFDF